MASLRATVTRTLVGLRLGWDCRRVRGAPAPSPTPAPRGADSLLIPIETDHELHQVKALLIQTTGPFPREIEVLLA